jgi:hypothetical protein
MGASADDPILVHVAAMPEDALGQLEKVVRERKPALVIIDTFIRFARLKDINDYAVVSLALEPLLNLARETGSHILLVHHEGKAERPLGDGILGSTGILGTVDTALILKRREGYRTVASIQRYGEDLAETILKLDTQTGCVSEGGTREAEDDALMGDAIMREMGSLTEPADEGAILGLVEGRKRNKEKALRELVAAGKVLRTGRGRKGAPYVYSVSSFLPPSFSREGESPNLVADVTASNNGGKSPSRETPLFDSPSRDSAPGQDTLGGYWEPVAEGIGDGHLPSECRLCKQARYWRSQSGQITCGVCHPPAPGVAAEWLGS